MSKHSEACAAYAALCVEVAQKTPSVEDRLEFLIFADAWDRLAAEIEQSERLVAFIDALSAKRDVPLEASQPEQQSYTQPLRQLTASIIAISDRIASDATAHHLSLLLKRRSG